MSDATRSWITSADALLADTLALMDCTHDWHEGQARETCRACNLRARLVAFRFHFPAAEALARPDNPEGVKP